MGRLMAIRRPTQRLGTTLSLFKVGSARLLVRSAVKEGFEPSVPSRVPVAKTGALDHSATPPDACRAIAKIGSDGAGSGFISVRR